MGKTPRRAQFPPSAEIPMAEIRALRKPVVVSRVCD